MRRWQWLPLFLAAVTLLNFYVNCAPPQQGTEGGNPFTSIEVKMGTLSNAQVTDLSVCPEQIRFQQAESDRVESYTLSKGDLSLAASTTDLTTLSVSNQTYNRVDVVLGSHCASGKSLRVVNGNGTFSENSTVTLSFRGSLTVGSSSKVVTLTMNSILDQLVPVTANSQVKTAAEITAGGLNILDLFTWMGSGSDANWGTGRNWYGGSAPGANDVAVFDGNCAANCSALISSSTSVRGVKILGGYSGVITQGTGASLTIGSKGWTQASGSFVGGANDIALTEGGFVLSGGSFTSTSGNLSIRYSRSGNLPSAANLATLSGGAFFHNGGQLALGVDDSTACTGADGTVLMSGGFTWTLNNLSISAPVACQPSSVQLSGSGTIAVLGSLTHSENFLDGSVPLQVRGNLVVGGGADGGTAPVVLNGTGVQTYLYTAGGRTSRLAIDKASGSVSAAGGTTALSVSSLSVLQGVFTAPAGTLTIFQDTSDGSDMLALQVASGSTFNANGGTVKIDGTGSCIGGQVMTIDVPSGMVLNHLTVTPAACQPNSVSLIPGRTLVIAGNFTHAKVGTDSATALDGGTWEIRGNAVFNSPVIGSGSVNFTGTANQTVTRTGSGVLPRGSVTVNKASGTLTLGSNLSLNASGQTLTLSGSSIVDLAGRALTVNGVFTIEAGATLKLSSGTHSEGTLVNNGAIVP